MKKTNLLALVTTTLMTLGQAAMATDNVNEIMVCDTHTEEKLILTQKGKDTVEFSTKMISDNRKLKNFKKVLTVFYKVEDSRTSSIGLLGAVKGDEEYDYALISKDSIDAQLDLDGRIYHFSSNCKTSAAYKAFSENGSKKTKITRYDFRGYADKQVAFYCESKNIKDEHLKFQVRLTSESGKELTVNTYDSNLHNESRGSYFNQYKLAGDEIVYSAGRGYNTGKEDHLFALNKKPKGKVFSAKLFEGGELIILSCVERKSSPKIISRN